MLTSLWCGDSRSDYCVFVLFPMYNGETPKGSPPELCSMADRSHKMVRLSDEAANEIEELSDLVGGTEKRVLSDLVEEYADDYRQELAAALAGDEQ